MFPRLQSKTYDALKCIPVEEPYRQYDEHRGHQWSGFKSLDGSYKSAAAPSTCSETCEHCEDQFLPAEHRVMREMNNPVELHDDDQAAAEIKSLIHTIRINFNYIRGMIDVYGSAIAKRWQKRPKPKRKELLLTAEPNMYPNKHAEIGLLNDSTNRFQALCSDWRRLYNGGSIRNDRDAILMPYLDLPSLTDDPLRLLSLMHNRAHYAPDEWILFDCQQIQKFFHMGCFRTAYNPHCVVAYGDDFGKLVPWEKEASHKWDIIGYPRARLALLAQSKLSTFLRKMVDLLLAHDLERIPKDRDRWDRLAATGFKNVSPEGVISAYADQAFSPPPQFDVDALSNLFETRLNAAEDDVRLLQTDPIYMRQLLDRFERYRQVPQIPEEHRQHLVIQQTLKSLIRGATWHWALAKIRQLSELKGKLDGRLHARVPLPPEYESTLSSLELGLKAAFRSEIDDLDALIFSSPAFRHHLSLKFYPNLKLNISTKDLWSTDKLMWSIVGIHDFTDPYSASVAFYLASIDEILSTCSTKEKARIDQLLYNHLAEIAVVNEALSAIRYHRCHEFSATYVRERDLVYDHQKALSTGIVLKLTLRFKYGTERLWAKLEDFRKLPMPSSKLTNVLTEETILQKKDLQNTLSNYWQEVKDVKEYILARSPVSEEEMNAWIKLISIGLNEACKAKMEEAYEQSLRTLRQKETSKIVCRTVSSATSSNDGRIRPWTIVDDEANSVFAAAKVKIKTRPVGEALVDVDGARNDLAALRVTEECEYIAVSKKSFQVFRRMFARSIETQGPTQWREFVAALTDAGFSATCRGGSTVTFRDERSGKGAIGFDRPHPDSTIDQHLLRGWAKRLTRWFGWSEDTFVLRGKQDE